MRRSKQNSRASVLTTSSCSSFRSMGSIGNYLEEKGKTFSSQLARAQGCQKAAPVGGSGPCLPKRLSPQVWGNAVMRIAESSWLLASVGVGRVQQQMIPFTFPISTSK